MISIPDFYANRDVFITGGTGFMGKVLIEKLLRSCSNVHRIFVLLRSKRGKSIDVRLEEIKNSALFSVVREKDISLLDKLIAVEGCVGTIGLAFTPETLQLLENVSIIFHSAASVRFDDELKSAILLNTRGTHEVIKFALSLKEVVSFVHVSTTYCHPEQSFIDEKIYPARDDWRKAIEIGEKMDVEVLEMLMPLYTRFSPNTYTFTKALSERICHDYSTQLPIVIVRPSIVTGSEREPFPGWCDNFNGPVGLLVACGIGIMRTMYASHKSVLNCIAVDIVIKSLIVAAWACGNNNQEFVTQIPQTNDNHKALVVYNCSSLHKMSLGFLVYDGKEMIKEAPFERALWVPGGGVTTCQFMNSLRIFFFQLIPAAIVDEALKFKGKKPFLMKLQRKIANATTALRVFVFNEWTFGIDNFMDLNYKLLPSDIHDFDMSRKDHSITDYYMKQIIGARRYLLNEPDSSMPASMIRQKRMIIADKIIKVSLFLLLVYVLLKKFDCFELIGFFQNTSRVEKM
ncbi:unnamed protein product [Diamesa serratosioi]